MRRSQGANPEDTISSALSALLAAGVSRARCQRVAQRLREHHGDPVAWLMAGLELGKLEAPGPNRDGEAEALSARQLERLVDGFAGEMSKLDEVLGVLSAYARRMRGRAAPAGPGPEDPLH